MVQFEENDGEDLIGNEPSNEKHERHYEHSGSDLVLEENDSISQSPRSNHVLLRLGSCCLRSVGFHGEQLVCPREEVL